MFQTGSLNSETMPDCPYCDQSFTDESDIREHLYEHHERDELTRIDTKRVEQYIGEHGLDQGEDEDGEITLPSRQPNVDIDQLPSFSRPQFDVRVPGEQWELREVRDLPTGEIVEKLDGFGIEITKPVFREEAEEFYSASDLADQWFEQRDVAATGHDEDFVWMAAIVLWERWMPDEPNIERINDLIRESTDLIEQRQLKEGCEKRLQMWEMLTELLPENITSISKADDEYARAYSFTKVCMNLEMELGNAAVNDPDLYKPRIEFCREFLDRFPDSSISICQNMRHAIAESLAGLGRIKESEQEFQAIIDEHPDDVWAYVKWGDIYHYDRFEHVPNDPDRAKELYERALKHDIQDQTAVEQRLENLSETRAECSSEDQNL